MYKFWPFLWPLAGRCYTKHILKTLGGGGTNGKQPSLKKKMWEELEQ